MTELSRTIQTLSTDEVDAVVGGASRPMASTARRTVPFVPVIICPTEPTFDIGG